MRVSGFFRCSCKKIHTYGGMNYTSRCTCSVLLYRYAFEEKR